MNFSKEITQILDALLSGVQDSLKNNLVGLYLRGSLALGDFNPDTSDIDLLAATEHPANNAEFAALAALHTQLATFPNPYTNRIEIAYVDRLALKRFQPGLCHPTLGRGETLMWSEHHNNWILERWAVREHGITLFGPDPQSLIDPITPQELRQAVCARLSDWADWAQNLDDPEWLLPRSHKAYAVETMCRALYTLAHEALPGKPQAVAWAMKTLPEPWRSTVQRSQKWRIDDTVDLTIVPEVHRFILWAAAYSSISQ